MPTVALCIICHDRPEELREALASAEGSTWDEVIVVDMASDPPLEPVPGVTWERSDENLGVTAGRNRLCALAQSDVLVFLDDDAVLCTDAAGSVRERFATDARLGLIAFRAVRPGGSTVSSEYPFRGGDPGDLTPRPCTYFVGCGYAARRTALSAVGGYDESFFYSTEEVDLGFRLMRDGWTLLYDPQIVIEHRPSARGRGVKPRVPGLLLRNRLLLVRRHHPMALAAVHGSVWVLRTLRLAISARALGLWWSGLREGLRTPVTRQPFGWKTLLRVHRLGGRVLW